MSSWLVDFYPFIVPRPGLKPIVQILHTHTTDHLSVPEDIQYLGGIAAPITSSGSALITIQASQETLSVVERSVHDI